MCRPSKAEATGLEVIAWFHDEDVCFHGVFNGFELIVAQTNASLNSVAWTYDQETGDPVLCVAGQNASINLLNIKTKKFLRVRLRWLVRVN